MSDHVQWPEAGIAVVTIARPPVNALDTAAYLALAAALEAAAARAGTRAIVLTGAGERAFCAGSDTGAFADAEQYASICAAGRRFFGALAALAIPVVGALNGPAVGAGAMIAADCDVLLAASGAYMTIPELSLGVPGAASHVKRLAPYHKVQRMLLLGERLTPEEAYLAGTVAEVVSRDALLDTALEVARRIAALEPEAVSAARRIFRAPESDAALAGYHAELDAAGAIVAARTAVAP
jgi:enoyl-CoA hydratase